MEARNKYKQDKDRSSPVRKPNRASKVKDDDLDFKSVTKVEAQPIEQEALAPFFDVDESAIGIHTESDKSFEFEARQVGLKSPAPDLGLTQMKDESRFDMNDFMTESKSYIYCISGYKDQTLYDVE